MGCYKGEFSDYGMKIGDLWEAYQFSMHINCVSELLDDLKHSPYLSKTAEHSKGDGSGHFDSLSAHQIK